MIEQATAEQVNKLSEVTGEGRMQCVKWVRQYHRLEALRKATTIEDLKEVLFSILANDVGPIVRSTMKELEANGQAKD